ncbi:hypothetical protein FHS55_004652 [Angulomicrobium tetraedrale]|uniref:Uncharacterized protein n=1 Tax=Ancylobacter tetraedralis TaxID=217068 RepID=A0A839ZHH3_9HYPH|nr:hypothetical protein [Ancylobacter tetraedralis]
MAQCVRSIEAQFGEGVEALPPPAAPAAAPAPHTARDRSAALFARIVGPGGSPA